MNKQTVNIEHLKLGISLYTISTIEYKIKEYKIKNVYISYTTGLISGNRVIIDYLLENIENKEDTIQISSDTIGYTFFTTKKELILKISN